MVRKILFAFIFGLNSLNIQAGWVITEKTRNPGEHPGILSTIYFQENIIKTVQGENAIVIDLVKREITFLDLKEKTFWKGNPDEYKNEVRKVTVERIRQELSELPPETRENYRELYENLLRDLQNPAPEFHSEISVRVEMTSEQRILLNYQSRKYNIYTEGFLVEELWISNRIKISDEVDLDKFRLFMNEMSTDTMEPHHRTSNEYLHLLKSGYPMLSKEFIAESEILTEVVKVEKKQIPAIEFVIPTGFIPAGLINFDIF